MWASVELALDNHTATDTLESSLVARARDGDKTAFEQLYRRNVDHVYAVCLRIAADVPRAEDFTQRTFIRAWEMLNGFRGESAFSSWLHRIAVNVVLLDYRSERRRMDRIQFSDDLEGIDDSYDGNLRENKVDLEQAISLLPKKARVILILHDIEGYQHEEIAIMLEIATGTSKSQLHRAHKLLKERLRQ
jgi:RNA polymerase sigma-70 factor (ECF subfamily)